MTTLTVAVLPGPGQPGHGDRRTTRRRTGCEHLTFKPVLSANLTTNEADSPSGLDLGFRVPQTLGFTPTPSSLQAATVTLPEGLTINPDAADGQTVLQRRRRELRHRGPRRMPRRGEDRHRRDRHARRSTAR